VCDVLLFLFFINESSTIRSNGTRKISLLGHGQSIPLGLNVSWYIIKCGIWGLICTCCEIKSLRKEINVERVAETVGTGLVSKSGTQPTVFSLLQQCVAGTSCPFTLVLALAFLAGIVFVSIRGYIVKQRPECRRVPTERDKTICIYFGGTMRRSTANRKSVACANSGWTTDCV
jgi:hypothetical protein